MIKTNDHVAGRIALYRAQAALLVADLEAKERSIPSVAATSNRRLSVAREIREARSRLATWDYLQRALGGVDIEIRDV